MKSLNRTENPFYFLLSLFWLLLLNLLLRYSVGKGVPNAPISTPKNIRQHMSPTANDITAEKDRPPYLVRAELQPIIV